MKAAKTHRLEVDLPTEAFAHQPWEPDLLATELRELWLLEQVRQRRSAFTKAAELTGLPLALFLERMRDHKITPFDLDSDEVTQELQTPTDRPSSECLAPPCSLTSPVFIRTVSTDP